MNEDKTKAAVFIIESLSEEEEEQEEKYEGKLLQQILKLSKIESTYYYIRTRKEFVRILQLFGDSKYRYLHLSCHGNKEKIKLTYDEINFTEFAEDLGIRGFEERRLFLSSCFIANDNLANAMNSTSCYSIIGFDTEVKFSDAAIFWSSFYHQIFKHNKKEMKKEKVKQVIKKLSIVFELKVLFYSYDNELEKLIRILL